MGLDIHVFWVVFFLNTFRSDSYKLTKEKIIMLLKIRSKTARSTDSQLIQL